jgi:hypothetical protein
VDPDVGFSAPSLDLDQGSVAIDPGAIGGTPGTPSGGSTGSGGPPVDTDAAVLWTADAAASPEPEGPCTEGEQRACEAAGCDDGVQVCRNGEYSPCVPPPEACNGRDDDCDGEIDENFPSVGEACRPGGDCVGEGVLVCKADGSGVECEVPDGAGGGSPEVCDGQDNDCDGVIDEDFPDERCCQRSADCGPGQTCDESGHCIGGDPVGPGDPGDPGDLGFGSAPISAPFAACDLAQPIPGPGEYPGATGGNGDELSCAFFPTGGGESVFTLTRAEDTEVHLYAFGGFLTNTLLAVRTDCANPGTELACNDDTEFDFLNSDAELFFTARAGQTYAVIVDSWFAGGTFTLLVEESPVGEDPGPGPGPDPGPDPGPEPAEPVGTCAAPADLVATGTVEGNTEAGARALALTCGMTGGAPEAVARYRIDHPARVTFSTEGSAFDTVLGIRTACDAPDTEFACRDDAAGGNFSVLSADLNPNVDYYLVVDGYNGASGAFRLTAREDAALACSPNGSGCAAGETCFGSACETLPAGLCQAATPLRPEIPVDGTLAAGDADAVPTGADCRGNYGSERVFAFVPPVAGTVEVNTVDSVVDTVLTVYADCGAMVGGERGCNDDGAGGGDSRITFEAEAGRLYYAVVEGFNDADGDFRIVFLPNP